MRLPFDDVKTACAAGDIEVPTYFHGLPSLSPRGVQATVESQSINAAQMVA